MPITLEAITNEALELPRKQQIRLAHYLLSLDDELVDPEVEAAWEDEIAARLTAYREGRLETIPFDQVKRDVELRLSKCR
jgi:putative addiction module component (TIGR02574 family)